MTRDDLLTIVHLSRSASGYAANAILSYDADRKADAVTMLELATSQADGLLRKLRSVTMKSPDMGQYHEEL